MGDRAAGQKGEPVDGEEYGEQVGYSVGADRPRCPVHEENGEQQQAEVHQCEHIGGRQPKHLADSRYHGMVRPGIEERLATEERIVGRKAAVHDLIHDARVPETMRRRDPVVSAPRVDEEERQRAEE